jgi:hypothetical protein
VGNYSQMWNSLSHDLSQPLEIISNHLLSIFLALLIFFDLLRYFRAPGSHTCYGFFDLVVCELPSRIEKRSKIKPVRLVSINLERMVGDSSEECERYV